MKEWSLPTPHCRAVPEKIVLLSGDTTPVYLLSLDSGEIPEPSNLDTSAIISQEMNSAHHVLPPTSLFYIKLLIGCICRLHVYSLAEKELGKMSSVL